MEKAMLRRRGSQLIRFYQDEKYYHQLLAIGMPIAMQNFIISSLNMVGVMMIGQLGDVPIAGVGLANQIFFLLQLLLFGITSGTAMFTAQLWGSRDIRNIRRVLSLALFLGLAGSLLFLVVAEIFPQWVLGIYSKDPAVVELGSQYLRISGWSFIFLGITFCYSAVLRSTGDVRTPLLVSILALSFNTILSYLLIFGKLGLPRMGVPGAAIAVLLSRILECAVLLWIVYRRKSPVAVTFPEMLGLDWPFIRQVLKPVLPVVLNEILWSLGITTYTVVYARIGTESIAAMNIAGTIDSVAAVIFIGLANATAILVGNRIGANEEDEAYRYSARTLSLGVVLALMVGVLIFAFSGSILTLYKVTPAVIQYTQKVLIIIACLLWLRVSNMILFVGVFRSGGDTRFAFLLDAVIIWVVGVPLAFLGAFVFHLPVYWVYLLVMTEEFTKWAIGMGRFFSKKWIHNLAQTVNV